MPNRRDLLVLLGLLALTLGVGALGGLVTGPSVKEWYPTLTLPSWRPPNAAFPIVWTALYIMMAIAAWRIWRKREQAGARPALYLWGAQLALNLAWSFLFFGARSPLLGLIDIVPLLLLIALTTHRFLKLDRLAGLFFLPYLAWVAFASALNATIFWLN